MSFTVGAGITNIDLLYTGVPRIPDIGEEVFSDGFSLQLGGGIPATLINLGRLGVPVEIATSLGDDIFSAFAKEEFKKNNIQPENLYTGDGFPVNVTSAIVLENDRSFITYGRGNIAGSSEACDRFYNLAHGSKITLMQPDGFLEVYRRLRSEGTVLVLDTGWDDEMTLEKYRDYIETADYYTPNRKEALKITGAGSTQDALGILSRFFEKPVIKLDRDGSVGIENGERVFQKSIDVFRNVDSTGAGDAFLAGFVFGLFYGYPLKECLLFGNITGGKCVTKAGALSAFVTRQELLDIAEKYR